MTNSQMTGVLEWAEWLFRTIPNGCAIQELLYSADGHPCDFRFIAVNSAFEQATGLQASNVDGQLASVVFSEKARPWLEAFSQVVKFGTVAQFMMAELGVAHPVFVRVFRIREHVFGCVFFDCIDERQADQQHRAEKMKALGQLAGGVAHEFNNQFSAIISNAELLKDMFAPDEAGYGYVNSILTTALDAAKLSTQLMAFSRRGVGQRAVFSMHQLLEELTTVLRHVLDRRIQISYEFAASQHLLSADRMQIQSAIMNGIINARDAMPNGGKLTIRTSTLTQAQCAACFNPSTAAELVSADYMLIEIIDTGNGIAPEVLPFIFEPFYTTKPDGSGMGLSESYGIIQAHRGQVQIKSDYKMGTNFQIYLPISQTAEKKAADSPVVTLSRKDTIHVLLIEDEELLKIATETLLKESGYAVYSARNAAQAIEIFQAKSDLISLVILDMMMPDISGYELFPLLRRIKPDLKVLIASGYVPEDSISKILEEPGTDFVQKPYQRHQLVRKMQQLLG